MRVGEFACIGDASAWSAWLDVEYMRTVAYDYARLRVRGGGVGRRGRRRGGKSCSPRLVHRASRECRCSVATVGLARTRR